MMNVRIDSLATMCQCGFKNSKLL